MRSKPEPIIGTLRFTVEAGAVVGFSIGNGEQAVDDDRRIQKPVTGQRHVGHFLAVPIPGMFGNPPSETFLGDRELAGKASPIRILETEIGSVRRKPLERHLLERKMFAGFRRHFQNGKRRHRYEKDCQQDYSGDFTAFVPLEQRRDIREIPIVVVGMSFHEFLSPFPFPPGGDVENCEDGTAEEHAERYGMNQTSTQLFEGTETSEFDKKNVKNIERKKEKPTEDVS